MFERIDSIEFPKYQGIMINMMPFIIGDINTLPENVRAYINIIELCNLKKGDKAYLSINESVVAKGKTQRRPGIHTDGTSAVGWGGGSWGGNKKTEGIWMASSDGRCRVWNSETWDVDNHGGMKYEPEGSATILDPSVLYWMSDRTPHESLPALAFVPRQWFRLVADNIGIWWEKHSTPNPFGVQPNANIIKSSKFI